jgi:hypothetical protein
VENLGRALIVFGGVAVVVGLLFLFSDRLPFRIGRLPLDFSFQRGNFSFYFPLGTSIVVSLLLTLVFGLLNRR